MVHAHSLPARILANIAIWVILVFGGFLVLAFKDYTIGIALAILSLCKWKELVYNWRHDADFIQHSRLHKWRYMSLPSSGSSLS